MSRSNKFLIVAGVLIMLVVVVGGVWCFLFFGIARPMTPSMANTIIPGDHVLYSKRVGQIQRGDLVIFKYPPDPKVQYIKRVVGLPGETIQLHGTKVLINSRELPEARTFVDLTDRKGALKEISSEGEGRYHVYYEKRETPDLDYFTGEKYAKAMPFLIPQGQYFLLGDSRDNSLDSRYWGTVPRELITGKVLMILSSDAPGGAGRAFTLLK